jgi:hypothetical protein
MLRTGTGQPVGALCAAELFALLRHSRPVEGHPARGTGFVVHYRLPPGDRGPGMLAGSIPSAGFTGPRGCETELNGLRP